MSSTGWQQVKEELWFRFEEVPRLDVPTRGGQRYTAK